MDWLIVQSESDLEKVFKSQDKVALFKHSTRCPVSSSAKRRLEASWQEDLPNIPIYYLDLIKYRLLSNRIAEELNVVHQSPQLILLNDGEAVYHSSHQAIDTKELLKHI